MSQVTLMRNEFLSFAPPLIGEEEIAEVIDTLRSDWITTGPKVKRFEQEFAAFVQAPQALAVSSCTAAMHVALATLGIGPGDAVISTPMTFCSTIHVIEHVGARPILVDVEPDTLNINPDKIEQVLRSESRDRQSTVRAILPVHLYGHPCELDPILSLASQYDLAVVEDAAHALAAEHRGSLIGSVASEQSRDNRRRLVCFSFYATKNLTTAEGGMLTGPPELLEEARIWSLHGMSHDAWKRYSAEGSWYYEVIHPGFKYNLTDIQAALGLHQLHNLPVFQARRREIARRYNQAFSPCAELQTPTERPGVTHAWHIYLLRLNLERLTVSRNQFIAELTARRIGTSVHFIPVHLHPYYRDKYAFKPGDFPVAYGEYQRMLSLPLYPRMSDQDVQDVIDAVRDVVDKFRRA